MSRDNPRIEAQRAILQRLADTEFDVDGYTGEFIDDKWLPKFHFQQGIENFRAVIQEELAELDQQEAKWRKQKEMK